MPAQFDARDAVTALLEQGLLAAETILDSGLTLHDTSRRSQVVAALPGDGPAVVLKQGCGQHATRAIRHEAALYALLEREGVLAGHLPHRLAFDSANAILYLERPAGARTLLEWQRPPGRIAPGTGRNLGDLLGRLHCLSDAARAEFPLAPLPWVFGFQHPSLAAWRQLSGASRQIVRIVRQSPAFNDALEGLTAGWQVCAPMHGDVRWSNCLVGGRPQRLALIDWEAAGLGDPAWDMGCVFAECLRTWLHSVPLAGDEPVDRFLHLARIPLDRLQPFMAACWSAWLERTHAPQALEQVARYAGARLVQATAEMAQGHVRLSGVDIVQLQLALNMLQQPGSAAERLFGLVARPETA